RERRLKNLRIAMAVVGILLAGTVFAAARDYANSKNPDENEITDAQEQAPKQVTTVVIGEKNVAQEFIHASGEARAATSVDISSQTSGTISAVMFGIGDRVSAGDALIILDEGSVSTAYQNAQTAATNARQSLAAVRAFSDESVGQAEINVQNAEESLRGAEIALDSAQSNLENSRAVIQKTNQDAKESAILAYQNNIASAKSWLDQINYLIGAEDGRRLEEIKPTLSVQNNQALIDSRITYRNAKDAYAEFAAIRPTTDSVTRDMLNIVFVFELAKRAADGAIEVLDNTIANSQFSDDSLNTQKTSFAAIKSSIITQQSTALSLQQALKNIPLNEEQQLDALESAADQARSGLDQARIALTSARASLD
ncbi:MAG: biotin/lipoyl-binding protein, partial [Patescibacteria group bacterium]|nr:biotin/lipoyl-binding protein [Patescibacteria group bacterium]